MFTGDGGKVAACVQLIVGTGVHCDLRDVNLYGADFESAVLINCDLSGANAVECNFKNASLINCKLYMSNLNRSDMSGLNHAGTSFAKVSDAVNAALLFHHELRQHDWDLPRKPQVGIGIHAGETMELEGKDDDQLLIASHAAEDSYQSQ